MKKTYQRPTALAVRVVTGNLMVNSNNPDVPIKEEGANERGLTKRMYGIEVE